MTPKIKSDSGNLDELPKLSTERAMDRRAFVKLGTLAGIAMGVSPAVAQTNQEAPAAKNSAGSSSNSPAQIITYAYPRLSPKSATFKVRADGRDIFAYRTSVGSFAAFACDGQVQIEIEVTGAMNSVRLAPGRHGIVSTTVGNRISFQLPGPINLLIEIEGLEHLFLFVNPTDQPAPKSDDPGVRYFKGGQVYEVGELRLAENETLYLEGGAVVRGSIRATGAKNVRIAGPGVLDGSYYSGGENRRSIVLEDCRDSRIEDIIMIEPTSWMIKLGACENVTVRNVRELGAVGSTDGVDIVGSRHIRVENCFLRNGDDCIAIKSMDMRSRRREASLAYNGDVEDVEISGCSLMSYIGGNAMEIGHELRTDSVRDIRFRDCDVLAAHGHAGIFGIHNSDHATISDVLYENIRVEHHYEKLVDLRVIKSRWSKDTERGQVRNVTFRNIEVTVSIYSPGYTISLIGGYDAQHTIEHVRFENFRLNGKPVTNADELSLYCKQASDITFA